jgi:aminoglycoside phosphotransferase (APT) family kinase protein
VSAPDATLAAAIAARATGTPPRRVQRFTTGAMHYVFEAQFDRHPPLVVRIAADYGAEAMAGASKLSRRLRPIGVPLPAILAENLAARPPYLVLERLPGTDLGDVVHTFPGESLAAIAGEVARAQRIVGSLPSAGRYGYAVDASEAPHRRWSAVILDSFERSCRRIADAGLFGPTPAAKTAALIAAAQPELDAQPAIPFLHDTTTKNVIVTPGGQFSGIVDVDDLCFGDPRLAPALTLAALRNLGAPEAYVTFWLRHAGLRADRLFNLYVTLFLLDFMSEHGRRTNGNEHPSTSHDQARLRTLFEDSIARADPGG